MIRCLQALSLALAVLLIMASSLAAQHVAGDPLARMAWLTGCWEGRSGDRFVEEHWLPARGGTLVSAARASRGDSTTSVELVVLRVDQGRLVYDAHPVGQAPTSFPAVAVSDTMVTFANPEHDFPKRIIYRRMGADSLVARIEGPLQGREVAVDYSMRRVDCPRSR